MVVKKVVQQEASQKSAGRGARAKAGSAGPALDVAAAQERDALADLMSADNPDLADPRWTKIAELSASKTNRASQQGGRHCASGYAAWCRIIRRGVLPGWASSPMPSPTR